MRTLTLAAMLLAGFALSACNTVAGAGKDVQSVGKATEGAAKDSGAK